MTARLRGDFAKLQNAIALVSKLGGKRFAIRAARAAGSIAIAMAKKNAALAKAPSGRRWAPPKKGTFDALTKVASSLALSLAGTVATITSSAPWAGFQQAGGRRRGTKWVLPARRILPKTKPPKRWADAMATAINNELRMMLRRS